ncbi:MAG: precorrin-3B C(17)-methyltransferase [Alphaproteobacteria bacterium]|nr:precorrin-3B C(17)-methyltransferase [Alphaproteobacteria bacterium]
MIALIVFTSSSYDLAKRIQNSLKDTIIHVYKSVKNYDDKKDIVFDDVNSHLCHIFKQRQPIVGICAAGILIRSLANVLHNKEKEPPVLAIDHHGTIVIPLLGGHKGANKLTQDISRIINAHPCITTASDQLLGFSLDDLPWGWKFDNQQTMKEATALLLEQQSVNLNIDTKVDHSWLSEKLTIDKDANIKICLTEKIIHDYKTLSIHPATLAIGIGCERFTDFTELEELVLSTLSKANLSICSVACLCSIGIKMIEPAFHELAKKFSIPLRFFNKDELNKQKDRLINPSQTVFDSIGVWGVAESAALAAVGEDGQLIVEKQKSNRATCAIARSNKIIAADKIGQARGTLSVVGLGPGSFGMRTNEAEKILLQTEHIVGYEGYIKLIENIIHNQKIHLFALGQEQERVEKALDLASQGSKVALVCSGDPGIYAMASLVFECLDKSQSTEWSRIYVQIIPGISAMHAVSARFGAPLGHDFCAVSLSDLLTPWGIIEKRITAAAQADFVIAFYNPTSRQRDWQLQEACRIINRFRDPLTPVIIGQSVGRAEEKLMYTNLQEINFQDIDMFSLVIIGNSQTRKFEKKDGNFWIYTPRGYKL